MSMLQALKDQNVVPVIVLGTCSEDPDAYMGQDVRLGASVEWQVSDSVPGNRGSSEDFTDPLLVLDTFLKAQATGVFMSPQEGTVFMRDLVLRLTGMSIADLEDSPEREFFGSETETDPEASMKAMEIIRNACSRIGLDEVSEQADVMMRAITEPGFAKGKARQINAAVMFTALLPDEDVTLFRKSVAIELSDHLSRSADSPSP